MTDQGILVELGREAAPTMRRADQSNRASGNVSADRRRSVPALRTTGSGRSPRRPSRVKMLVGVALLLGCLFAADGLVGSMYYNHRQAQLASDFRTPRPWTGTGRANAVLQIPKIALNDVVVEGVGPRELRGGPGHVVDSAAPGATGNAVLVAHRTRYGGPFSNISRLGKGDRIYLQPKGATLVIAYTVKSVTVGSATDVSSNTAERGTSSLTLVTSSGGWRSSGRTIVVATPEFGGGTQAGDSVAGEEAGSSEWALDVPANPLFNREFGLGVLWAAVGVCAAVGLARRYPRRIALVVVTPAFTLALIMLWFNIDRLLPRGQ
jgi:sortase A